jgi:hypothetical protein
VRVEASALVRGQNTETVAQAENVRGDDDGRPEIRHVVLVSVDGLHQTDVDHFIAAHSESTFAELAEHGVEYTDAHTTTPSDSFPGLAAAGDGRNAQIDGLVL